MPIHTHASRTTDRDAGPVLRAPTTPRVRDSLRGDVPHTVGGVVAESGRPLDASVRAPAEQRLGHDFSKVRIHTDAYAAGSAADVGARAYTVGRDVVFGAGRYAPGTPAGRGLIAHELTHVADQGGRAAVPYGVLQRDPTTLGDLPATERQEIQVSTIPITVPAERVTAFFSTTAQGRPGETQSIGGTTTVFDSVVDASLRTGLGSVGAWLATSTNALPMNTTLEVELDLSAHGGAQQRFRFTRSTRRSGRGASGTAVATLLVESVGPAVTAPAPAAVPSSVSIAGATFPVSGTWQPSEYGALHQALTLLPAAALTRASGVTFERGTGAATGTEAGHFDAQRDTIVLHDEAFETSSVRVGGRSLAVRNVVHEVGHALDLRPLEQAWQSFDQAGQTPAARRKMLAGRSPSGTRWVQDAGTGDFSQKIAAADHDPEFRRAVRRDGVRPETATRTTPEGATATLRGGATTYADADYQELFAESFALYVTAPDTLQALRPQTFAYFRRAYPSGGP